MKYCLLIFFSVILYCQSLQAAQDYYYFADQSQKNRFEVLTQELRCLVCQNQNIAESNAPLAADLRTVIYQQIRSGQANKDIVQYLVARYGNFILYKPPLNIDTIGLWFGPSIFLMLALGYLFFYIQKREKE